MKSQLSFLNFGSLYFQEICSLECEDYFYLDGYIRLNMIYIHPKNIKTFFLAMKKCGMLSWTLQENGLYFNFGDYTIGFIGNLLFYGDEKIFALTLDFEPHSSSHEGMETLELIEDMLKSYDANFFMLSEVNLSKEILFNPLSNSLEYLERRIREKYEDFK